MDRETCENCGEIVREIPTCSFCGIEMCETCVVKDHTENDSVGDWCGECSEDDD